MATWTLNEAAADHILSEFCNRIARIREHLTDRHEDVELNRLLMRLDADIYDFVNRAEIV